MAVKEIPFMFGGTSISLLKAKDSNGDDPGYFDIRIVANSMLSDRDGDLMTREAFDKAVGEINRIVVDWFHKSRSGKTEDERYGAVLGTTYDFKWEQEDGRDVPVFYARVTKAMPQVEKWIAPHLYASVPALEASVGGRIIEADEVIDPKTGKAGRLIKTMEIDHIAIAPRNRVRSPGSHVSLVKAESEDGVYGSNEECGCNGILCYNNLDSFKDDINKYSTGKESLFAKALEVGYTTDSTQATGVDAIREQSLEGKEERQLARKVGLAVRKGELKPDHDSVNSFVIKQVGKDKASLFMKKFSSYVKMEKNKG